jgi:hypothetical protein
MVSDLPRPGEPITFPMSPVVQQALMSDLTRLDGLIKRIDVAITTPPGDGSVAATELADETRAQLDQTITPSRSRPDLRVTN